MKVLHVIDSGGLYGAEKMVLTLMEEQLKMGLVPILGSIGNKGIEEKPIEIEAIKKKITTWKFRINDGPNFIGAYKIVQVAKRKGVDLLHSHGYKGNILFGFIPKVFRKIPLVSTLHGWTGTSFKTRMKYYEYLDKLSLRFIDSVVVVDKAMTTNTRLNYIKNISVINNGIILENHEDNQFIANDLVREFCSDAFIFGTIGRLSPEKGHSILLKAFHEIMGKGLIAKLVIFGEGWMRDGLRKIINELNLDRNVLLAGYVRDAKGYLSLFNTFVLPSFTEGLPITILEAMHAGIPIISTKVGGVPEALDHGKAGILVEPNNIEELKNAMLTVYNDKNRTLDLAQKAKEIVCSKYKSSIMAEKYYELYKSIL